MRAMNVKWKQNDIEITAKVTFYELVKKFPCIFGGELCSEAAILIDNLPYKLNRDEDKRARLKGAFESFSL